jgi:L-threonylcarbamoyladenylate synthase
VHIIKLKRENINAAIKEAAAVLMAGGIVAYPTETFYGLGVRFDDEDALRRLHRLKGRGRKAMPLIIGDRDALSAVISKINKTEKILSDALWPGPLTIAFKAKKGLSKYITKNGKVAVRIPSSETARMLADVSGLPITATSANPSGMPPAGDAGKALDYFGEGIDIILDGGRTKGGLPSTIIEITGEKIKFLREGAVPSAEIKRYLKDRDTF